MGFIRYEKDGKGKLKQVRNRVVLDCQKAIEEGEECIVQQHHKEECDVNNIVKKYGADLIQKVGALRSQEYRFDNVEHNDFQEAMYKVAKATETFEALPSNVRAEFNHDVAMFLDDIQNPGKAQKFKDLGLAPIQEPDKTIRVEVTNESLVTKPLEVHKEINTPEGEGKN